MNTQEAVELDTQEQQNLQQVKNELQKLGMTEHENMLCDELLNAAAGSTKHYLSPDDNPEIWVDGIRALLQVVRKHTVSKEKFEKLQASIGIDAASQPVVGSEADAQTI